MHFTTQTTQPNAHQCVFIGMYDNAELAYAPDSLLKSTKTIAQLFKNSSFDTSVGSIVPFFGEQPIIVLGCGPKKPLSLAQYRKIILAMSKAIEIYKLKSVLACLPELAVDHLNTNAKVRLLTQDILDNLYKFDLFKSEKCKLPIESIHFYLKNENEQKECQQAIKQALAIADAMSFTKNLANTPSNICTPSFLAEQAQDLTKSSNKFSLKVLDEETMRKMGMGALLGVSQGSAEEAKLICLEYHGTKKDAPIAFVGKGITFDTGGNSLKPADSMVGMKYDMCGAATVLGVLKAAASLQLPLNLVGVIAAAENMPGGTAYKPEDILTSLSGQTIEVMNTDAEGRLILADALTYCERFNPEYVIDIATLTGAVVIALGVHATGLLSNDEALAQRLLKAGIEANDRAWQLPLWDEYQEQIKSPFADMANTGGRSAGTITAACFLSRFAKKFRWAHLDVAGTAAVMGGTLERKATGRPVPMLVQFLLDYVAQENKKHG